MKNILICDNDTITNTELESIILNYNDRSSQKIDYEIISKITPENGNFINSVKKSDLILLSCRLDAGNVEANIKKIRHINPDVNIIITGSSDLTDEVLYKLVALGVNQIATKPFSRDNLFSIFKGLF